MLSSFESFHKCSEAKELVKQSRSGQSHLYLELQISNCPPPLSSANVFLCSLCSRHNASCHSPQVWRSLL